MNLSKIKQHKGQFLHLEWCRCLPTLKTADVQADVRKVTTLVARLGVEYSHTAAAPEQPGELRGREWVVYPLVKRSLKTGKLLLAVTPVPGVKPVVKFFVDGVEVARDALAGLVSARDWKARQHQPAVLDVPVDCLTAVTVNNINLLEE